MMTPDELNDQKLRDILARHPAPEPDEALRAAHIAQAKQAFEKNMQKNATPTQGMMETRRLTDTINQLGSSIMSVLSGKHRASVAFASIGLAALGITTAIHLMPESRLAMVTGQKEVRIETHAKPQRLTQETADQTGALMTNRAAESGAGGAEMEADASFAAPPAPPPPATSAIPQQRSVAKASRAPVIAETLQASPHVGYVANDSLVIQPHYQGRDRFEQVAENTVKAVSTNPVSTFSIDVDTASYSFVRRQLTEGRMPAPQSVRVEEMINYFDYQYPLPEHKDAPFSTSVALYPTPWNEETRLMHVGLQGYDVERQEAPRSNLVFLIDTSGSMSGQDRLPLLISSLKMLLNTLDGDDTIGIVTYAGSSGIALEPTKVSERSKILSALEQLRSGGSTAGAAGIETAYRLASEHFDKEAVNRVILATDGDFNVGIRNPDELKRVIETKRESGIFLSVLGFGQGNYNDALMQTLAQNGNGTAAYIDTLSEARKVLVEEASSALFPIAKDVKIQIEFNPAKIAEYRLIGYETRHLNREDFNNDKVDAGELGAGHTVTAIYEITPVGSKARMVDDLRYSNEQQEVLGATGDSNEYAFLKLRYKLPDESKSRLITRPVTVSDEARNVDALSNDMRFAAAVAAFGQKLRGSRYLGDYDYGAITSLAEGARGEDRFGYRAEFINLVRLAASLDGTP